MNDTVEAIRWDGERLSLLDQRRLPGHIEYIHCESAADAAHAIREMVVRGAPAIGITAAYGMVLSARQHGLDDLASVESDSVLLSRARPTAVNLFWALDRCGAVAEKQAAAGADAGRIGDALLAEAHAVLDEDIAMCRALGRAGQELLADPATVLTHCNAGGLATGGYGTAVGVVYAAREAGKRVKVYADETRPLLQGARLTAWELADQGIDVTLLCDSAAATVLRQGRIDAVITGADRIVANGDAANKIGTYPLAVLAARHNVPFYIAAPLSTFDPDTATGDEIEIEQRDAGEVTGFGGRVIAPGGVAAFNPAFDVTPAELITAIITEQGVFRPPYTNSLGAWASTKGSA